MSSLFCWYLFRIVYWGTAQYVGQWVGRHI